MASHPPIGNLNSELTLGLPILSAPSVPHQRGLGFGNVNIAGHGLSETDRTSTATLVRVLADGGGISFRQ